MEDLNREGTRIFAEQEVASCTKHTQAGVESTDVTQVLKDLFLHPPFKPSSESYWFFVLSVLSLLLVLIFSFFLSSLATTRVKAISFFYLY